MEENDKIVLESTQLVSNEQKQELSEIITEIELLEDKLKAIKEIEISYDAFRKKLFEAMTKYQVTKYVSQSGIQFTITKQGIDKTEILLQFDENKFKEKYPTLYKKFLKQVEKVSKGKASYLRITLPKEGE